jgi:hypothetical protein
MYHNHKNNIQKHLFFQNAIKLGKKEMKNQTYHTLTEYSKFLQKIKTMKMRIKILHFQ